MDISQEYSEKFDNFAETELKQVFTNTVLQNRILETGTYRQSRHWNSACRNTKIPATQNIFVTLQITQCLNLCIRNIQKLISEQQTAERVQELLE